MTHVSHDTLLLSISDLSSYYIITPLPSVSALSPSLSLSLSPSLSLSYTHTHTHSLSISLSLPLPRFPPADASLEGCLCSPPAEGLHCGLPFSYHLIIWWRGPPLT